MTEEQPIQESKIIVDFSNPGSAHFYLEFAGVVTSNQLLMIANYLDLIAKDNILTEKRKAELKAEKPKIALPNDGEIYSGV